MEIVKSLLTQNPCYKAGRKIQVKGLMLHSVGCAQASAQAFVRTWNNAQSGRACVHAFIDGNTGTVYQTLPWNHRGWHCGGKANDTHIGVEMCEPNCLKYTSGSAFTCTDRETALAVVKRTYEAAVELFAELCREFSLNPLEDGVIISHHEGHTRGWATGHADPEHLWEGLGAGFTMDGFRHAVAAALKNGQPSDVPVKSENSSAAKTTKGDLRVGDAVKLVQGAVYYDGRLMPDWVTADTWILKSVNGDRAVIDKNVAGSRSINSPVNLSQLIPVSAPKAPAAPIPAGEMRISERGTALIAKYEGCRLNAYKCPAGVWTIGYGHTAGVKPGDKLPSRDAAMALLREDLVKYATTVNSCVKSGQISFPLTQNQFDALTSFCYNCGAGNLRKLVAGRSAAQVAEKILAYNKGGGKVLAGLAKRREEERALFLTK